MSILWVVLIIFLASLVLGWAFMKPEEVKQEEKEESYSEQMLRWKVAAEEESKRRFMESIREPVFSFLKVFNESPKRFRLKCTNKPEDVSGLKIDFNGVKEYSLTDLKTGEEFKFSHYRTRGYKGQLPVVMLSHEWLEGNEVTYLYKEINKHYTSRASRKSVILHKRKDRILSKERERLVAIYGGGE